MSMVRIFTARVFPACSMPSAITIPAPAPLSRPTPGFAFLAPWPNPARGAATFAFELDREAAVTVAVYDVAGRVVARPVTGERFPAGPSVRVWRPGGLAGGIYIVRATIGERSATRRIVWLGTP